MVRFGVLLAGISLLMLGAMFAKGRQDGKPPPSPQEEKSKDLLAEPEARDPWEYRLVPLTEFSTQDPLPKLQQLGRSGWELAGTLPEAKGGSAVFKRRKANGDPRAK